MVLVEYDDFEITPYKGIYVYGKCIQKIVKD